MSTSLTYNAFHVLGLTGAANQREVSRQSNLIVQRLKIDDIPAYELDIYDPQDFRTEDTVKDALRRLQAPKTRVREYFFWFLIADEIDRQAAAFLAERDFDRAIDIWAEAADGASAAAATTYRRNRALVQTVSLIYNPTDRNRLERSLSAWSSLLNSIEFWSSFVEIYKGNAELPSDEVIAEFRRDAANDLSDIYAELHQMYPDVGIIPAFQRVFAAKGERIDEEILAPIFDRISSATDALNAFKLDGAKSSSQHFSGLKQPLTTIQDRLNELIDTGLYESSESRVLRDRVATAIRRLTLIINNEYDDFLTASQLVTFAIEISGTDGLKSLLHADLTQIQKNISDERDNTYIIHIPGSHKADAIIVKPDQLRRGETIIYFKDASLLSMQATNHSVNGIPTSQSYIFMLCSEAATINLRWTQKIGNKELQEAWEKLAHFAAVAIIPNISERLLRQIFADGQTPTIGGIEFSRNGYSRRKRFGGQEHIPWTDKIWIPEFRGGKVVVWKNKNGKGVPFSTMPMSTGNAVVIPNLIEACSKAATRGNR